MEDAISCIVCHSHFDRSSVIPKVLNCGHTFCLPCITKVVEEETGCPTCRSVINGNANDLPTNYSLLEIMDSNILKTNLKCHLISVVEVMKNKFKTRKEILFKKKSEITSSLKLIEDGLTTLEEWNGTDSSEEFDTRRIKEILGKLEKCYKKSEDLVRFNFWKLRLSISIFLSCFETPQDYLVEIYNRVQNEENIYSAHQFEDIEIYGKVSLYDNKLVFHSLCLSETPRNSSLIWFDELKQCRNTKGFYTFIKISCNEKKVTRMVLIEMGDKLLSNQFIKLCTGECGVSYKNTSYKEPPKSYDSNPDFDPLTESESIRHIEYHSFGIESTFQLTINETYLTVCPEGKFTLNKALEAKMKNDIHGRVVNPNNLENCIDSSDPSFLKIMDCGIVFEI